MGEVSSNLPAILCWSQIELGKLIGSGSFASVYKVKLVNESNIPVRNQDNCLVGSRVRFSSPQGYGAPTVCSEQLYSNTSDKRLYALKIILNIGSRQDNDSQAAIDYFKVEAELLSELPRHEHIINLIGVSSSLVDNPTQGGFIVLEHHTETLAQRLWRWKIREKTEKYDKNLLRLGSRAVPEQHIRIKHIGLCVAEAMSFLHQNHVVYRDLKPANIGFDSQDQVKLFDFGLARKIDSDVESEDSRELTMQVGTLRYMSPELCCGSRTTSGAPPYDFSTDVYSFAILLWEIITLQKPFGNVQSLHDLTQMVFRQHQRPNLRLVNSRKVRQLLQASWDPDPELRPSFAPIVVQLLHSTETRGRHSIKQDY